MSRAADPIRIIQHILKTTESDFRITMRFDLDVAWTIVVCEFQKHALDGEGALICVADLRSIECLMNEARPWKRGVGLAGEVFATNREEFRSNVNGDDPAKSENLPVDASRPNDRTNYRSLMAVPIRVHGETDPWGVVCVTSNQPNHFLRDRAEGPLAAGSPEEGARMLAGCVAIVLALTTLARESTMAS